MRPRSAFTLIELLVVIAVIMLLAALALPVLTGALTAAQKTTCMNNIHQLYVATMQYTASWGNLYPPLDKGTQQLGSPEPLNVPNMTSNLAFRQQLRSLDERILFCPANPDREWHIRAGYAYGPTHSFGYDFWCGRAWREGYGLPQVAPYLPAESPANSQPDRILLSDVVRLWDGTWLRSNFPINNHINDQTYATTGGYACFVDGAIQWTAADKLDWDRYYKNWPNSAYERDWTFCIGFRR